MAGGTAIAAMDIDIITAVIGTPRHGGCSQHQPLCRAASAGAAAAARIGAMAQVIAVACVITVSCDNALTNPA